MSAPRPWGGAWPELGILALVLAVIALVSTCSGCGGSAVRVHATAASVAMVAMSGAGDAIEDAALASIARCAGDAACLDDAEEYATTAAAARDALIPAVHAYRDAVLLAVDAEETPSMIDALLVAALRVAREWDAMREALAALGVDVPAIPFPGGAP